MSGKVEELALLGALIVGKREGAGLITYVTMKGINHCDLHRYSM